MHTAEHSIRNYRIIIVLFAAFCIANPFVLFLLSKRPLLAVGLYVGTTTALLLLRRWRVAFLIAVNIFVLCSVVVHAEAALVYAFPERVIANLYSVRQGYYFNQPYLHQQFTSQEFSVAYRTNAQGFRIGVGQEPSHSVKTADWLFLGDSFTQGAQVEFEELFSTRINLRFPDKIVINAGISGMGIAHEYRYFADQGRLLQPSLVILQVGSFNDFMNVEPWQISATEYFQTKSALFRLLLNNIRYPEATELPLGRWVEPFRSTRTDNASRNVFFRSESPEKTHDLNAFEHYLALLKHEIDRAGGRLLVVLLPTREQIDEVALSTVLTKFDIRPSEIDLGIPNRMMARLSQKVGFEYLDLQPALQPSSQSVFFDVDEHLTPYGHSLVASAIGDYISQTHGASSVKLLSKELAGDRYPSPSQDRQLIAFQSIRDGRSELFVASRDFTNRRRVTYNNVDESHPVLSKDNSRVLFTAGDTASLQSKVAIIDLATGRKQLLTSESNVFGAIPSFAHSNLEVAYAQWQSNGNVFSKPQIAVRNLLTGAVEEITSKDREGWRPVFSGDDRLIAYIAKNNTQYDLFIYDRHLKAERQLTHTSFDEWDPQFSPDSKMIIYAARADENWDLFITELSNGRVTRLTRTRGDEWDPAFLDGMGEIVFAGRFGTLEAIFEMCGSDVAKSDVCGRLPANRSRQ